MMDWKEFEYQLNENNYISPFKSTANWKVMQYSELKDKHGKEIYEGDLLQGINCIMRMDWDSTAAGWVFNYGIGYNPKQNTDELEVIGNIYENPELLAH